VPSAATILLIDDDAAGRQMMAFNLRQAGNYEVEEAATGEEGLERFDPGRHDLVITDVRMAELSGIDVVRAIRTRRGGGETPVLVISAYGTIDTAVEAMKAGALDFVLKPFGRDQLRVMVSKALEHRRLTRENHELKRQLRGVERPIAHRSRAMTELLALTDRVAPSRVPVLVTGESGTGKELIARRIHARSERGDGPFVVVNCAAIAESLIEAELFGHEKGAFTGAGRARRGRFRLASGGSIFLDEIGELPLPAQSKLLRVLQEGVIDVVGGDHPLPVDVRVIAATNSDLQAAIAAGSFREDLFFRLNVIEILVPPLRDRPEDLEVLLRHFVSESAGDREVEIPPDLIARLRRRRWRGNVRELRNACERMVLLAADGVLSDGVLSADEAVGGAVADGRATSGGVDASELLLPDGGFSLLDLERTVIERVLRRTGGNVSEAARYLRVPRHVLVYRIEKYGIERPRRG
jgi:two-component system NtrC family response regulator